MFKAASGVEVFRPDVGSVVSPQDEASSHFEDGLPLKVAA